MISGVRITTVDPARILRVRLSSSGFWPERLARTAKGSWPGRKRGLIVYWRFENMLGDCTVTSKERGKGGRYAK